MIIKKIESFATEQVAFVRVTTDDGAQGMGQISPYNADLAADVLHRMVAPIALGADAMDTETLCDRVIEGTYKFPGSFVCRALTGLDTALWDMRGKVEGKSVCELLGGTPKPLVPYGSSMSRDITPADEAARLATLKDQYGFRAFKIRVGSVNGHDVDQWPGRTEALVPTVRAAVGDDVAMKVDGNSCYTPARALEVARLLGDYGYTHFEEPCPYWKLDWTREVTRFSDVPIAGGEQDYDLEQWQRMTWGHVMDIAQPDICYLGGITRTMRVCKMAETAGMPVVPHSANLSMVTLFTLHVLCAIPNAGEHYEHSIERNRWVEGLFAPALEVIDGEVMMPEGPGWGIEVNPEWLAKADYQASELDEAI